MNLEQLASKYIASAETVFKQLELAKHPVTVETDSIRGLLGHVKDYLNDAKYYKEKKRYDVSLTAIAYCEGMLDALKMLGAVQFEWPTKKI